MPPPPTPKPKRFAWLRNLTTTTQAPQVFYIQSQDEDAEPKLDPIRVGLVAGVLVLATVGLTMFFMRK